MEIKVRNGIIILPLQYFIFNLPITDNMMAATFSDH